MQNKKVINFFKKTICSIIGNWNENLLKIYLAAKKTKKKKQISQFLFLPKGKTGFLKIV